MTENPRGAGTLSVEETLDRIKIMTPQRARFVLATLVVSGTTSLGDFWHAMRIAGDHDDR